MKQEQFFYQEGPIDGVEVKPLLRFEDGRGWLIELYREDEVQPLRHPVMAYVSQTLPGVTRGPHEHRNQTDYFAFIGPGDFKLYLWDARSDSPTAGKRQVLIVGESDNRSVIVPPGVVHAYKCISSTPGIVYNAPNQLYAGQNKTDEVDEIRHEDIADSPFMLD
ncbi:MAG: dTDP-4-dehydrorhamnose 3,5-epimerase family protein [Candidatus Hatepunaea meridiana]|nr:dTDP-4-dehydrorhamnose 3,5-epimerase family protein [Candidatus Hatepunaea meridiana]